nr:hypothetical protein [uncultured Carboxylicivirga sp.]
MNATLKMTLFWLIATIITLSAAVYQRLTGPTHPKRLELITNSGTYPLRLLRSHGGDEDCRMTFVISDSEVEGSIAYRRYPTHEDWTVVPMIREADQLVATLPNQPAAGKLEYKVEFNKNGEAFIPEENHTIIRFKGGVPSGVLIPHVLLMFFAMLISNLAGILAIANHQKMVFYTYLTFALVLIGGMIFGPVMQKYAFGEYWTGFPYGYDLTDNKTLIAFIFWIIAVVSNIKKRRPIWIIVASVVMLTIYLIPHSMFGSELDYESGSVITGE